MPAGISSSESLRSNQTRIMPRGLGIGSVRVDRAKFFDAILRPLLRLDETLLPSLLFAGSTLLYEKTVALAYETVHVRIPIPGMHLTEAGLWVNPSKLSSIVVYPRLATHVKYLHFAHPPLRIDPSITSSELFRSPPGDVEMHRREAWDLMGTVLRHCRNVESVELRLGMGLGEEVWRELATLPKLSQLRLFGPPPHPSDPVQQRNLGPRMTPFLHPVLSTVASGGGYKVPKVIGEGGWSLGIGWEGLKVLELSNLSQNATKTLSTHLHLLSHQSNIVRLYLSTHFLDTTLCTAISHLSSKLQFLELSTTGTKFNAECLRTVIEGCHNLDSLFLDDIEGRLEKDAWSSITRWPTSLRWVEISISEYVPHHSWVTNHLASIHCLPFDQLDGFLVRRVPHPISRLPFPPPTIGALPFCLPAETLPDSLLQSIRDAGHYLTDLGLDWWDVHPEQLGPMLSGMPHLRVLRISVQMSMHKLISMASAFAAGPNLEEIHVVSISEWNLPGTISKVAPLDCSDLDLPSELAERLQQPDSTLPDTRDLRKFVRKLPHLRLLSWTGRGGKGDWRFTKKTSLVNVSFTHAAVSTLPTYIACQTTAPMYPFEEVTPNPLAPGFMCMPTMSKTAPAEFPALSRSTTAESGTPPAPRTPLGRDVPVVNDDPHEHFRRLSINSTSTQNGPAQVLRLDITKASKITLKRARASTVVLPGSKTKVDTPTPVQEPAVAPSTKDRGSTSSAISKFRKRQASSTSSSRGRASESSKKTESARSETQGGEKKTLRTTKEAQDGWTVVAKKGSGK